MNCPRENRLFAVDITLGQSAGGTLWLQHNRRFYGFPDALSWGPVQRFSPARPKPWFRKRISYWNRLNSDRSTDSSKQEAEYLQIYEAILRAKALTLWLSSDVDSLVLAAWLAFIHHSCQTGCQFQLIQFPRRVGSNLAIMRRDVLANPPAPQLVKKKSLDFLPAFWQAWSAATPRQLLELFKTTTNYRSRRSLISSLLNRYPDADTGLTYWDQDLLRAVRDHGPRLVDVVVNTLDTSDGENVGATWLVSRLYGLANPAPGIPLVKIGGSDPSFRFRGTVSLTRVGAQVLSEETSAINRYWVNDWVGGVRLSTSHPVWLRTHDGLVESTRT